MAFDLSSLATLAGIPLVVLLLILVVLLIMKILKYAILVGVIAAVYFAWRANLIPGVPA